MEVTEEGTQQKPLRWPKGREREDVDGTDHVHTRLSTQEYKEETANIVSAFHVEAGRVPHSMYRVVQKYSCMLESSRPLSAAPT